MDSLLRAAIDALPGSWVQAQRRAAAWLATCPPDVIGERVVYVSAYEAGTAARDVLTLTVYALAAPRGRAVDAVTSGEVRDVLTEHDTPGALIGWWTEALGDLRRHEPVSPALRQASHPAWDDTLSLNSSGPAPHPVRDGPPVVLAALAYLER
jgi:hypothetical protein